MISLPIDALMERITASLKAHPNLVIEAPPGAGKTTRVPPALLGAFPGEVLVLEPRRLAVRLAARRVAAEMGEALGRTVGYQVRFEDVGGAQTRLRFLTEGVLVRRMVSDAALNGVGVVVLDEFHERHAEGDLALALLLEQQRKRRRDLRIVAMSATLDAAPIAAHLGDCPAVRSEGRLFECDIRYTPHSAAPLEEQVAAAVARLHAEGLTGDVLAFLPGAAEIRRAARALEPLAVRAGLAVLPLHGDLPPDEQDRAIVPNARRKVILSTNVAESSVTIDGVTAVIDSGLARVASDSPWTGLPTLTVERISKASATQRAGRAARTAPGRVVRLYSADDFARRAERDQPEILRRELSQTLLDLAAMGIPRCEALPWLDAPPAAALDSARALLQWLGAMDAGGELTPTGRRMARFPLHPRLARLAVEAEARGVATSGCRLAAALSAGERLSPHSHGAGRSDVVALLDQDWAPSTRQVHEQLRRQMRPARDRAHDDAPLLISILAAFPDRVARQRQRGQLALASGGAATLSEASHVRDEFLVAVDIEDRRQASTPMVRLASGIDADWLLELFPGRVDAREGVEWNKAAERVEATSALTYGELAISESRAGAAASEQAAELLAAKAWEAGWERFTDPEAVKQFQARVSFAAQFRDIAPIRESELREAVHRLCNGIRSFSELRGLCADQGLVECLAAQLAPAARRALEELAPTRIRLPGGRATRVNYVEGQTPWIESRLQDFFGMRETPRLAGGRVPVVVHLLAPSRRPVQTTTDLAGFWQRLYPELRRQLMRRYPKHAWPENP